MESVTLSEYCAGARLGETEAWAVMCEACHVLSERIAGLVGCGFVGQKYEDFIVCAERLELSAAGQLVISNRAVVQVREYLPIRMKPLLELTVSDLASIGMFSLAKVILANIEDIKSQDLLQLLAKILSNDLSKIPSIKQVLNLSLNIISRKSALRIISSMFYKYQGLCNNEYGARNFSTTRSLPCLPRSDLKAKIVKPVSTKSVSNLQLKHKSQDEQAIESVCDYIKNNDVFGLLDLPGLKYNRKETRGVNNNSENSVTKNPTYRKPTLKVNLLHGRLVGQTVRMSLITGDILEINLIPTEVTIGELLDIAFRKSKVENVQKSMFCVTKRKAGEHFYLSTADKVSQHAEHGVQTFHMRLLAPPTIELRRTYSKQLLETNDYGIFKYEGRENKNEDSAPVVLKVSCHGLTLNEKLIEMKNLKQVSCSQTFLQVLFNEDKMLKKIKVCFSSTKTKLIHSLINILKDRHAASQKLRQKEMSNLEDLCDQLLKITKSAIKVISTPSRKRSKSADAQSLKSNKRQKLNRSLTFTESKNHKNKVPSYQYKLYLENEEDEQYVHLEKLQMMRKKVIEKENIPRKTKITTIPNSKLDQNKKPLTSIPRQGPVIMGTTTLKRRRLLSATTETNKIVCVSMNRKEFLENKIVLRKSEEGVFIHTLGNKCNSKMIPGDRIVAVNGTALEDCSLEKANCILASSGHLINFILSR